MSLTIIIDEFFYFWIFINLISFINILISVKKYLFNDLYKKLNFSNGKKSDTAFVKFRKNIIIIDFIVRKIKFYKYHVIINKYRII